MKMIQNIVPFVFYFILIVSVNSVAQKRRFLKDPDFIITSSTPIDLEKELRVFENGNKDALYRLSIGADVPNNKKPMQVIYQSETGHIFLTLQKITGKDTINKVWGFYPAKKLPLFFKKNVTSQVKDNSKREHDVELVKTITEGQFQRVLELSLLYAKRKYHLNKFNCYDYALKIFNDVTAGDTLPIMYVKFPMFFGKGGSPCSFYKYMKQQKEEYTSLSANIVFGNLVAPASTKIKEHMARNKE